MYVGIFAVVIQLCYSHWEHL